MKHRASCRGAFDEPLDPAEATGPQPLVLCVPDEPPLPLPPKAPLPDAPEEPSGSLEESSLHAAAAHAPKKAIKLQLAKTR